MWRVVARTVLCARRSGRGGLSWLRECEQPLPVPAGKSWRRHQHNGSIYMHHATVGAGVNSAAVTLGLIHSLSLLQPGIGYFRPIDSTSHGGHRSKLVKEVYKLPETIEQMQAFSQREALALIAQDRIDDLIDDIIKAYEEYKARHDFVVIEGTSLKDGTNTVPLNAAIAAALSSPAFLIADAMAASLGPTGTQKKSVDWSAVDWESDVVTALADNERILKKEHVEVVGSLVYKAPVGERGTTVLKKKMEELKLPFVGAIPEDMILQSKQVQDIQRALGAQVLCGNQVEGALSTEITHTIVGTLQLDDLIEYIPKHTESTKGAMIVSHVERPDILLGMLALHESQLQANLAAVLLTGGHVPSAAIEKVVTNRLMAASLPVLTVESPTYETCIALSTVQGEISPTSMRKIERAQILFDNNVDMKLLEKILFQEHPVRMNPKLFQHTLFQRAKAAQMHIVLPEGEEPRTIQAAGEVVRRDLARLTLLGSKDTIQNKAKHLRVQLDGVNIVDPTSSSDLDKYTELLYQRRKHKGMSQQQAREQLIQDVNFFGTAMVATGDADGMVSGAIHTTANTVRPALQVIKTLPETPVVSSVFFMCLPDKVLVYGDCAINTDPTSDELAMIAASSADTAAAFGVEPRVAMLSYATGDSNQGPLIQKVIDATKKAKELRPGVPIEGPLQYDAAVNPETAKTKMKGKETAVAGKANVLIFPDLNTGNNTYKAVQQSTGAIAMGPVLQGLRKPVNDLSRGCTVQDIVTTIAITAVQAKGMKKGA